VLERTSDTMFYTTNYSVSTTDNNTSLYQFSCHRDSLNLEQLSSGIGAGAGPTNDSRH